MCGIAGFINTKEGLPEQRTWLEAMTDKLAPRGPDACGFWYSQTAALGHRRLIVVDPSGGIQPMIKQRGENTCVLIYNGELYNTAELRNELLSRGHTFLSSSDTEVLLEAFLEWGPECAEHLNGIYAFAAWNEGEQSLTLCRDRFGVKPLFYAVRGNTFLFASELKSLLANPLIEPVLNADGLAEIFALGPARTPGNGVFQGVYELKPAHLLLYSSSGIRIRRYWALESLPHTDSMERTAKIVRELVIDAIRRQTVADVPVCSFLSGGLDSSAITAITAEQFKKDGRGRLHTYSIDYVNNEQFFKSSDFQPDSDAPWVRRMSGHFDTEHHDIRFDTAELADALTSAVDARDLPGMADVDSSLWLFCREVKKNATVALSGECADEVFGGYPWFRREDMLNAETFPWSMHLEERTRVFSRELIKTIHPGEYVQARYHETLEEVPLLPGETGLEARRREMFYLNFTWFMQTLLDRKDRMSMAHGLEVRVPFCDHRLVQYAWNIPWELKMLDGREKGLVRKALEGILPEDVLWRKKSPYPKTHNPSYEKSVKEWMLNILNSGDSPLIPLIDSKALTLLASGQSDYGKPWFGQLMATPQLFAYLIQVDYWMRKYHVRIA